MKIIILDRDGVINQDSDKYVKSTDEFHIIPGSVDAIANLSQAGFKVIVCTNQSGLGRGLFSMEELNEMHEKMHQSVEQAGGAIDAIIFCPHTPDDKCECRKPKPGMILDICERFHVEKVSKVAMIGDSLRDLEAIYAAGGIPILVKTGNGKKTLAKETLPEGTMIFDDLLAASEYVIEEDRQERLYNAE
ncbi:MAG: D-glycero-beta-D-manno-heptose 1,7-bisphosphate 7-phosphatase [Burkholderiales bacterium]|nr:D-glycero-beta-D-manno-heptose 1,7-bisphosphate 7-phosphatase [Burkholderiales bacterium]